MELQPTDIQSTLTRVLELLNTPFWKHWEFWIGTILGAVGVLVSAAAYKQAEQATEEAKKAKQAATEAGRTVKLQTITIELSELAQKLDRIKPEVRFSDASDLLNEVSRRSRRAVSPFANDHQLSAAITALKDALKATRSSLQTVRPVDPSKEEETPYTVYYAVQQDFATLNDCVADLLGLFEKQTLNFGEDDGEEPRESGTVKVP